MKDIKREMLLLKQLDALRASGALTAEEFETEKKKILSGSTGDVSDASYDFNVPLNEPSSLPLTSTSQEASSAAVRTPSRQSVPIYKKWWFAIIAIIIAVTTMVLVGKFISAVNRASSSTQETDTSKSTQLLANVVRELGVGDSCYIADKHVWVKLTKYGQLARESNLAYSWKEDHDAFKWYSIGVVTRNVSEDGSESTPGSHSRLDVVRRADTLQYYHDGWDGKLVVQPTQTGKTVISFKVPKTVQGTMYWYPYNDESVRFCISGNSATESVPFAIDSVMMRCVTISEPVQMIGEGSDNLNLTVDSATLIVRFSGEPNSFSHEHIAMVVTYQDVSTAIKKSLNEEIGGFDARGYATKSVRLKHVGCEDVHVTIKSDGISNIEHNGTFLFECGE